MPEQTDKKGSSEAGKLFDELKKKREARKTPKYAMLHIPSVFKEIDLGSPVNTEKARIAVQKYSGKIALVKDAHATNDNAYLLGVLGIDPEDRHCYYFAPVTEYSQSNGDHVTAAAKEEIRLWYNDLEGLIVHASFDSLTSHPR